jgi:hypothetical protein
MNDIHEPPINTRLAGRSADDLDTLLRQFYHAEMPNPWPAPPMPAEAPRSTTPSTPLVPRRPFRWDSPHLAMAATVALLLLGYLWLTSAFPSGSTLTDQKAPKGLIGQEPKRQKTTAPNLLENKGFEPLPLEIVPLGKDRKAEIQPYRSRGSGQPTVLHLRESK